MYKFKEIFVFTDGKKTETPKTFEYFSFQSYYNACEFLEKKGFKHYLFTLKEVK